MFSSSSLLPTVSSVAAVAAAARSGTTFCMPLPSSTPYPPLWCFSSAPWIAFWLKRKWHFRWFLCRVAVSVAVAANFAFYACEQRVRKGAEGSRRREGSAAKVWSMFAQLGLPACIGCSEVSIKAMFAKLWQLILPVCPHTHAVQSEFVCACVCVEGIMHAIGKYWKTVSVIEPYQCWSCFLLLTALCCQITLGNTIWE